MNDKTCINTSDCYSDPFTEEPITLPALVAAEQKNLLQATELEATSTFLYGPEPPIVLEEAGIRRMCSPHRFWWYEVNHSFFVKWPFSFWDTTSSLLGRSKVYMLQYGSLKHRVTHG